MWPVAFGVMGLGVAGALSPASDVELILWLGPPVGEYLATHVGRVSYRPGRTWLFGLIGGVALGRLFHRYLLNPADTTVWLILFLAGAPALLGALYATYERS